MTESSLSRRIREHCNAMPHTKAIKIHGNGLMEVGTPDLHVTHEGLSFWFETKIGRNKPSKIQNKRLEQWRAAGAVALPVWSLEDVVAALSCSGRSKTAEEG